MAKRPRSLIYGLLAASLALNLAGAGYLGVIGFRPKPPPRTVENTIDFVSSRYPPQVAKVIRDKLEERRPELTAALGEMKAARRATREAMSGGDFDAAKVDAAFATARIRAADFQKVIHSAIVAALPEVAESDRAKIDKGEGD